MSIWQDVEHDAGLAAEAIDELERLASHLDGLTRARHQLADDATADWHGLGRERFDHEVGQLLLGSLELTLELRRAAARIAEETEQAAAEQRRRARARALLADKESTPA